MIFLILSKNFNKIMKQYVFKTYFLFKKKVKLYYFCVILLLIIKYDNNLINFSYIILKYRLIT
jgi:hypothetical protein